MPEKINFSSTNNFDEEFLDVHDFNNAVEAIEKAKPDLVFDNEFPSLMDLAIDMAAKYLTIPVVSKFIGSAKFKMSKKEFFTAFLPAFFHSSMPYEQKQKRQFMRRGRFFLYKYLFLIKTWKATKMNLLKIIQYFFIVLKWHISYHVPYIDSRFANTLQWLQGEHLIDQCIKAGFSKSSLVVTGNPIYDEAFKKSLNIRTKIKGSKIHVLLVHQQLYESGVWTKKQRDFTLIETIENISTHNEFSLAVKLHPSSQVYSEYEPIIHNINSSIPIYQKGTIMDYLNDVDVMVSFVPISAVAIYALIFHIPLVLCNFFDVKYDFFLDRKLAIECKDPSRLSTLIHQSLSSNLIPSEKIENFIHEFLYKSDGRASERLADAITTLVNKDRSEYII